jgi:hypothetical protein
MGVEFPCFAAPLLVLVGYSQLLSLVIGGGMPFLHGFAEFFDIGDAELEADGVLH